MTKDNFVIWSNMDVDYDSQREFYESEYPDLSDDEREQIMLQDNDDLLLDERANLNIQLPQKILVIADLGLWFGRRMGYKEISSGKLCDCLYDEHADYCTWYVDRLGDLRCDAIHHDGQNHYLYRVYKDNVSEVQIERLKERLYFGEATRADITRVTRRLGDEIAKVYGFSLRTQHTMQRQAAGIER